MTVGSIVRNVDAKIEAAQAERWQALAAFYAEGPMDSYDGKLSNLAYIANSGIKVVAAQARAVHNAAAFDINFTTVGSIVRNLQAEMKMA